MKYFHYLAVDVFVHATEDKEKVIEAVRNIVGDATLTRATLKESAAEGYHKNPIVVLEWTLSSSSRVGGVLKQIVERVGDELISELENRVDEEGVLHIRLDKMKAYRGEIALARGAEPVVLRFKIAAYPKGRDGSLKTLRAFLGI